MLSKLNKVYRLLENFNEMSFKDYSTDTLKDMQKIIRHYNVPELQELDELIGIELSTRGSNLKDKMLNPNVYAGYKENIKLGETMKKNHISLKSLIKKLNENEHQEELSLNKEEKARFLEAIHNFETYSNNIYRSTPITQTLAEIGQIVEMASQLTLQETGDWFDKVTVSRHMKQLKESFKTFEKTVNEMNTLQQRLEMAYEDVGSILGKYYDIKGATPLQEKDSEYQKHFAKTMKKAKIHSPADLETSQQKKKFFQQVDKTYKSKEEKQ